MTRVFSYFSDKLLSELSVRLFDKEVYCGSVHVCFVERNSYCEVHSISFVASRSGSLDGFSARLEIDYAMRVAQNLTTKTITIDQLNNSVLVGELFD